MSVKVKGVVAHICIALLGLVALCGCHKNDEPEERQRPSLSCYEAQLLVGDTMAVDVLNADAVSLVSAPLCVDAYVDGLTLVITALKSGSGELLVRADGVLLSCVLTVIDAGVGDGSSSGVGALESDEQIAETLDNNGLRLTCGLRSFSYGDCGTIFSMSSDGCEVNVISLSSGETAEVKSNVAFATWLDKGVIGEISVSNLNFGINGASVGIVSASIMKISDATLWLRMVTSDNEVAWLVISLPLCA
jgi:hypothetical protein